METEVSPCADRGGIDSKKGQTEFLVLLCAGRWNMEGREKEFITLI
jgi:hypothetical protein